MTRKVSLRHRIIAKRKRASVAPGSVPPVPGPVFIPAPAAIAATATTATEPASAPSTPSAPAAQSQFLKDLKDTVISRMVKYLCNEAIDFIKKTSLEDVKETVVSFADWIKELM